MLEIIQLNQQPAFQFNIQFDNELQVENPITNVIEKIRKENEWIESFLSQINKQVNLMKEFNTSIIRKLEIFVAKTSIERQEIIKEHFNQVENITHLYTQMDEMK